MTTQSGKLTAAMRASPEYQLGYEDRLDGRSPQASGGAAYKAGYRSADDAIAILQRNGFERTGTRQFKRTTTIDGRQALTVKR